MINRSRVLLRQLLYEDHLLLHCNSLGERSAGYRAAVALKVTPEACCAHQLSVQALYSAIICEEAACRVCLRVPRHVSKPFALTCAGVRRDRCSQTGPGFCSLCHGPWSLPQERPLIYCEPCILRHRVRVLTQSDSGVMLTWHGSLSI